MSTTKQIQKLGTKQKLVKKKETLYDGEIMIPLIDLVDDKGIEVRMEYVCPGWLYEDCASLELLSSVTLRGEDIPFIITGRGGDYFRCKLAKVIPSELLNFEGVYIPLKFRVTAYKNKDIG